MTLTNSKSMSYQLFAPNLLNQPYSVVLCKVLEGSSYVIQHKVECPQLILQIHYYILHHTYYTHIYTGVLLPSSGYIRYFCQLCTQKTFLQNWCFGSTCASFLGTAPHYTQHPISTHSCLCSMNPLGKNS